MSTQRDSEKAALATEKRELEETPEAELVELTGLLEAKGLSAKVAREAAVQLTERDALRAHAEVELGIDPDELTNPWHAAGASFLAFTVGALLPLLAIVLPPPRCGWRSRWCRYSRPWRSPAGGARGSVTRRWGVRCCGTWAGERWRWR